VNALISIRQYVALKTLIEKRVFRSFSEAIREALEILLREYESALREEVKKE